jgi:hypothetical protein
MLHCAPFQCPIAVEFPLLPTAQASLSASATTFCKLYGERSKARFHAGTHVVVGVKVRVAVSVMVCVGL